MHGLRPFSSVSALSLMALALFGEPRMSYSVAAWTGLLNRHTLDWDDALLSELPVKREQLQPLCDVDDAWRGLRPEFAAILN